MRRRRYISHQYENEYYVTKVYNEYENGYIIRRPETYHFKNKRSSLIEEGKMYNIKIIKSYNMKKIADLLIEQKRVFLLTFVVKKMDDFGIDRDCIRKIMKSF